MHTTEEFSRELYTEHLEEISFLSEQRQSLFTDPEISWLEIEEFENRLTAHLDAMETGGEAAAACALLFLKEEAQEPCDIFAATYALTLPAGNLSGLFEVMEKAEAEQLPGYFEAFRFSKNPDLSEKLYPLLESDRPELVSGALRVLSERRILKPEQIPLQSDDAEIIASSIQALGRINAHGHIPEIRTFTDHQETAVKKAAIETLLRLGDKKVINMISKSCRDNPSEHPWLSFYLAVAGNHDHYFLLIQDLENKPETLLSLGILGNPKAVEVLISQLENGDDEIKTAVGKALELITGAGLKETVTVIEEIDPDELPEGEEPPEPASEEIERICTSYNDWLKWWSKNKSNFDSSTRYRYGQPFTPGLCLEEIVSEKSGFEDRKRACLELIIHTGNNIPFEPDWLVDKQKAAIEDWKTWWRQNHKSP